MTEPLRFGALAILLMLGLTLSGCMHIPDAAESAELAKLREGYACNPRYGYRALPVVAKQDVPLLPAATKRSWPNFPYPAMDYVKYGEVQVLVHIDATGHFERVDVVSENPRGCRFAEATIDAFAKWEFEPNNQGIYSGSMKFYIH